MAWVCFTLIHFHPFFRMEAWIIFKEKSYFRLKFITFVLSSSRCRFVRCAIVCHICYFQFGFFFFFSCRALLKMYTQFVLVATEICFCSNFFLLFMLSSFIRNPVFFIMLLVCYGCNVVRLKWYEKSILCECRFFVFKK